jgi:NADH-quinone oxidoreductase subunit J
MPNPPSDASALPGALAFYALAAAVVACAAGVAFSRNLLRSAFLLLGALAGVAGLYLTIGADFVGVVQLMIYVGGVLVLLLFAILMTGRIRDVRATNAAVARRIAVPAAALLGAGVAAVAVRTPWRLTEPVAAPATARLGDALLREALLPFELVSLILLMALVGAVVIARRAVRGAAAPSDPT